MIGIKWTWKITMNPILYSIFKGEATGDYFLNASRNSQESQVINP